MQQATGENQFVVELLTTLRKDGFSPRAWWRFLARSWDMSCATARTNPALRRSWLHVTLLMVSLTAGILGGTLVFEGAVTAARLLPGLLFCVVWQQSDLFWHLGLNRRVGNDVGTNVLHPGRSGRNTFVPTSGLDDTDQPGALLPTVGLANVLTGLRGLGAGYLLGRLLGGLATPSGIALGVFMVGVVTDIFDGLVARHTRTQSKLGQIADAETDFCLYVALTVILMQNGILPLWLGLAMLLRFAVPLLAALASYFLFAHSVRFGSTAWGKYAGLAQCLYFFVLLTPSALAPVAHLVNLPLLLITLALLIIAPAAQIVANVRAAS
jgi:phosphatidylglycerophosphate synthase